MKNKVGAPLSNQNAGNITFIPACLIRPASVMLSRRHIPAECYHQPYMPLEELQSEMKRMTFYGWEVNSELVGVMAREPVREVTLVRHAYVLTCYQGQGIGSKLIKHIETHCLTERLLVGTWKAATWATDFYERHGYEFQADKDRLLNAYWDISPRQTEKSVVLGKSLPRF